MRLLGIYLEAISVKTRPILTFSVIYAPYTKLHAHGLLVSNCLLHINFFHLRIKASVKYRWCKRLRSRGQIEYSMTLVMKCRN